jgi:bisphosphoglycerate-dependent phosphoglycerate mutase
MKHRYKIGNCINDKDTKFIKKLLKKNPISFDGRFFSNEDCVITISNIRKYETVSWRGNTKQFCYEIDVIVKLNLNTYHYGHATPRRKNDRIRRYQNEQQLRDELVYFNITDFQISKVTFEK